MADHLQYTQFFSRGILHPRRGIANPGCNCTCKEAGTPLCILTGFSQSLCPRHDYLFYILQKYRVRQDFIEHLRAMYSDATASVQINDTIASPYRSNVVCGKFARWAWPLCVIPAPSHQHAGPQSRGSRVEWRKKCRPLLAYADDFTHTAELAIIFQAKQCFEKATGAQLNPFKSKAITLGVWTASKTELGIAFHDIHYFGNKVLGVIFGPTIPQTMRYSETGVIHPVRAQARKAYIRKLFCAASTLRTIVATS